MKWRSLIVDDGSTKDRTPEIADEYEKIIRASTGPSIRKMADMARAVNTGLRNAQGIYYKVVDSDDWVDEERL